jgi:hypothetical protein
LASTWTVTAVSSLVVKVSGWASGASGTAVTVPVTLAVEVSPVPSATV